MSLWLAVPIFTAGFVMLLLVGGPVSVGLFLPSFSIASDHPSLATVLPEPARGHMLDQ